MVLPISSSEGRGSGCMGVLLSSGAEGVDVDRLATRSYVGTIVYTRSYVGTTRPYVGTMMYTRSYVGTTRPYAGYYG